MPQGTALNASSAGPQLPGGKPVSGDAASKRSASERVQAPAGPISLFDMFKVGIGPSSSHTMGPMVAAARFAHKAAALSSAPLRIEARALGSLAWTGKGHGTDRALALGLMGFEPETVEIDEADRALEISRQTGTLRLPGADRIAFDFDSDIVLDKKDRSFKHPNTMRFAAFDGEGNAVLAETWLSLGGGFVAPEGQGYAETATGDPVELPFGFSSGAELIEIGKRENLSIAEIMSADEEAVRSPQEVASGIDLLIDVMLETVERGLNAEGILPGGLKVQRRAKTLFAELEAGAARNERLPTDIMDHVSAFAMAVNEENAAGARMVTAPTNGAAGVFPAVLRYYRDFCAGADREGMRRMLLTAAAIGSIVKLRASISGAEVGCQGEVGTASAMAAAGLVAALGGGNEKCENAAEIAMEHHLGLTCDPVGGLVQIPCIERNAFGAIKAINAASLAMRGKGEQKVRFDQVVETMRQTGLDMRAKYKETSKGGLALNVTEC
ncbi:L-serine ammonia-lyase [Cucumibacter marinus]|uniref:L-serine ammonia-lyase n=1 Tax=Cucumibacter marinus TaxID=1121252 RepID=UPI000410E3E2|nr:L-serine ammonia-lyase [Cucumibacter marinus]